MQLGLALSGGGFRATLFHLGVVKALLDRGLLANVRHITSVSGGSVLAAHLVQHWSEYTDPKTFETPARKIIEFSRSDIRGHIFRRLLLPPYLFLPYAENLLQHPPRLRRNGTVRNLLFERSLRALFGDVLLKHLAELNPEAPRLDILATNLNKGALAYFYNGILVPSNDEPDEIETPISVARAVMISALFPAFFPTIELTAENLMVDPKKFDSSQYFTDGGVYDNLGIRRFQTVLSQNDGLPEQVIVSDASGAFDWLVGSETLGQLKTAVRSSEVFMKRLADLECELAGGRTSDQFTFLRISDIVSEGRLPESVQEQVKHVRTDLDHFSILEIKALVTHGYEVSAQATQRWSDVPSDQMVPWDPFPKTRQEPEQRAARRLRNSRFHGWGLFNYRDWASYVYPLLLLVVLALGVNWYRGERLHQYFLKTSSAESEILDRVVDPAKATALVESAVQRPHRNPEYRLETALLAYSVYLHQKSASSKALLQDAIQALDEQRLARFHAAKWRHFYSGLATTTFGFPACPDTEAALENIEDAIDKLAVDSPLHAQAAITSYGIYSQPTQQSSAIKKRAFDLFRRAIEHFDKYDLKQLPEADRFRATLIRGHYSLALGNAAENDAKTLMEEGDPQQAAMKYKEADGNFRNASVTYEAARELHAKDLWKVEFNVCNAAIGRATVMRRYIVSKEPMQDAQRKLILDEIQANLASAQKRCEAAHRLIPPTIVMWQPMYALGVIALLQGSTDGATDRFLEGQTLARVAGEQDSYTAFLGKRDDVRPLCEVSRFREAFETVCR